MSQKSNGKTTKSLTKIAAWFFICVLLFTELIVCVWSRGQCTQIKYDIFKGEMKYKKSVMLQDKLKIRFAQLSSPKRIAQLAKKAGLITPNPKQIYILK